MERRSKRLLQKERPVESLCIMRDSNTLPFFPYPLIVIKYKEAIHGGGESNIFSSYVSECAKQFNQIGMQMLNSEKFKISSTIFKILIKILSPYGTQ